MPLQVTGGAGRLLSGLSDGGGLVTVVGMGVVFAVFM